MRLAFDNETNGLLDQLDTMHCLVLQEPDTGEMWSATDHSGYVSSRGAKVISLREGLRLLLEADEIIGHNIIAFDIPAIQKVEPWFEVDRNKITDTLIMSRLLWPELKENDFQLRNRLRVKIKATAPKDIEPDDLHDYIETELKLKFPGQMIGRHSLEAWGLRLGEWKGDYSKDMKEKGLDPWASWNPEMQDYCEQDVIVTVQFLKLIESKGYSPRASRIEMDFAWVLAEMERNGFPFHMAKAQKLQQTLMKRHIALTDQLQEAFPPITEEWDFIPKVNNKTRGYEKGVPFKKSNTIEFNPSSRDHIAKWLKQKYDWKPAAFTDNGKPALDERVLKRMKYPEAKLLAEYFLVDKRLGMLEGKGGRGLIPFGKSGRIHGRVITNGAVTRRCTHSSPNMAQLPATSVPYGHEFRDLMYAPEGWTLVGWDAAGLELRCFAHYMAVYDGGKYTETVLSGDIHWVHVQALGLVPEGTERDEHDPHHVFARDKVSKRFIYAYLYGAGAETIGEIVKPKGTAGAKRKAGAALIKEFLKRTPALKRLKDDLKKKIEQRDMHVMGIDGGLLKVRSDHAALNTLLQSAGAVAVKLATILFYDNMINAGLRNGEHFMIVAHVHDEVQTLVKEGYEVQVGEAAIAAIREAGVQLGFKCPLDGEYKVGSSWAETH